MPESGRLADAVSRSDSFAAPWSGTRNNELANRIVHLFDHSGSH